MIERAAEILHEEGVLSFAKKSLSYGVPKIKIIVQPFILPYTKVKIKNFSQDHSLEEIVDFSFNSFGRLIKPFQVRDEILELLRILDKTKQKIVLEIGTANGGTLFLLSRISSENATLVSVDLPSGRFGGGYPGWKKSLYKSFALPNQKIHLIRADSHSQATLEKVKAALNGKNVDFLFIDGDHRYEGVKKDFEMYSPLVKKKGIIAFHDIVPGPQENVGGVPEFWKEVRKKYEVKEIVEDWNENGYGIGVLFGVIK